jgi:hypothetical protein
MKWLTLFFLLAIITSCSKSGTTASDNVLPVVSITSPAANQVFNGGQTINITAHLTDNARIVEVHVHISDMNTGALLIDIHRNPGNGDYALNENFVVQSGVQYKILILAKDNSANEGHAEVDISSN